MNLPYIALGWLVSVVLSLVVGFCGGSHVERNGWQLKEKTAQLSGAQTQIKQAEQSTQVVTRYVDRVQVVEKQIPVVRERIIEHCGVRDGAASSPAVPDGAAAPDAPRATAQDTFAQDLSDDIAACGHYVEQLNGLQEWVKANSAKPPL